MKIKVNTNQTVLCSSRLIVDDWPNFQPFTTHIASETYAKVLLFTIQMYFLCNITMTIDITTTRDYILCSDNNCHRFLLQGV